MYDLKNKLNSIDDQINLLQQQKNTLLNYQPPIQQNFITQSKIYDFYGYWCSGADEAKNIPSENHSLIIMDKNEDKMYLRLSNGDFKAYEFKEIEVITNDTNDAVTSLKELVEQLKAEVNELKEQKTNEQSIQSNGKSTKRGNERAED